MKKVISLLFLIEIMTIVFLLYFMFDFNIKNYRIIEFKNVKLRVPDGYKKTEYNSNGWDVIFFRNRNTAIKIAAKPAIDIEKLADRSSVRYKYNFPIDSTSVFYIIKHAKNGSVVFAFNMDSTSYYISVWSVTISNAYLVLKRVVKNMYFGSVSFKPYFGKIPESVFIGDYVGFIVILLTFLFIPLAFYFSSMKPRSVIDDEIVLDEKYVGFYKEERFRRKKNYCYLLLRKDELTAYFYGKPVLVARKGDEIKIEGRDIIIKKDNQRYIITPAHIDIWYEYLKEKNFI